MYTQKTIAVIGRMIDLSVLYTDKMPVWPGDDAASLQHYKDYATHGYSNFYVCSGMHVGTHLECSNHMLPTGKMLTDYPLDRFQGKAVLFDLRGKTEITQDDLDASLINGATIALLCTGHAARWGTDDYYYTYPVLTVAAAQKLLDNGIMTIGLDTPSPDKDPFETHKTIFARDGFIIENLTNLEALVGVHAIEISALPPRIKADACIVRVVAMVD